MRTTCSTLRDVVGEGHALRCESAAIVVDRAAQTRTATATTAVIAAAARAALGRTIDHREILQRQRSRILYRERPQGVASTDNQAGSVRTIDGNVGVVDDERRRAVVVSAGGLSQRDGLACERTAEVDDGVGVIVRERLIDGVTQRDIAGTTGRVGGIGDGIGTRRQPLFQTL